MSKKIIHTSDAPAAIGPYSQAVKFGKYLFTSGQLGIIPTTGELAEGVEAQTEWSLRNIGAILKENHMDYCDVIKSTVFVADLADFAKVNAIYQTFFEEAFPACSCVQVAALPKGGLVEIECIAAKKE